MTRDEAVIRIQRLLGFRTDKTTEIVDALKDEQLALEEGIFLPWFLGTEVTSASTTAGEERVQLPTGFLREVEEDALYYFNPSAAEDADKWVPLEKDDLQEVRRAKPGTGAPVAYSIDHRYFRIFPTPDAVYTLKIIFMQADAILTTNIENDWLKHAPDVLIGGAGIRIAEALRDDNARGKFETMRVRGEARMIVATEARQHTARRYVMGGPD